MKSSHTFKNTKPIDLTDIVLNNNKFNGNKDHYLTDSETTTKHIKSCFELIDKSERLVFLSNELNRKSKERLNNLKNKMQLDVA